MKYCNDGIYFVTILHILLPFNIVVCDVNDGV